MRIEKNRGIRILPVSLDQLIETFQIRIMLEVPLTQQAATVCTDKQLAHLQKLFHVFRQTALSDDVQGTLQADRDYHLAVLAIVGNSRAINIISDCRNTVLLTGCSTIPEFRSCLITFEDHMSLHQAIMTRNAMAAAAAMRSHILNTAQLLVTQEAKKREQWSNVDVITQLNAF